MSEEFSADQMRDKLNEFVAAEVRNFFEDHSTKSKVKKIVRAILEKDRNDIIMKVLGFSSRWAGSNHFAWEIDSFRGESEIQKVISKEAGEAAVEWVKEIMGDGPQLNPAQVEAIQRKYTECFNRKVEEIIRQKADRDAAYIAEKLAVEAVRPYLFGLFNEEPDVLPSEKKDHPAF